jgi:hypothetical protein
VDYTVYFGYQLKNISEEDYNTTLIYSFHDRDSFYEKFKLISGGDSIPASDFVSDQIVVITKIYYGYYFSMNIEKVELCNNILFVYYSSIPEIGPSSSYITYPRIILSVKGIFSKIKIFENGGMIKEIS